MFSILLVHSLLNTFVIRLSLNLTEQLICVDNHNFIHSFCQVQSLTSLSLTVAKIGIPAPSACSLGTTLPEFQPHFHALKPQCLIIGLAQPYCD